MYSSRLIFPSGVKVPTFLVSQGAGSVKSPFEPNEMTEEKNSCHPETRTGDL